MGLDIYVMPLRRFMADDFEAVIERGAKRMGMPPPKFASPQGITQRTKPKLDAYRVAMFKRMARNVVERVAEFNRPAVIDWNDEGECIYAERCWDYGMKSLRTYALWLGQGDKSSGLTTPPEGDFYRHPLWAARDTAPVAFPHLIEHDCYMSYYLPCDFEKVTKVAKVVLGGRACNRVAASSVRLQDELQRIQASLDAGEGLQALPEKHASRIRQAYQQMKAIADLSCSHCLPIIFWG